MKTPPLQGIVPGRITVAGSDQGVPDLLVEALDLSSDATANRRGPWIRRKNRSMPMPAQVAGQAGSPRLGRDRFPRHGVSTRVYGDQLDEVLREWQS